MKNLKLHYQKDLNLRKDNLQIKIKKYLSLSQLTRIIKNIYKIKK